jgi:carbonic anhydrase/acetyltransferase-like protein (isoleucine patch superfamily)
MTDLLKPILIGFDGAVPLVSDSAWLAGSSTLVGRVTIGPRSSVWFNTVLRGDGDRIVVGEGTNLQDGVVVHSDPGVPVSIGDRVSVGHQATLHGCTVEDDVLVGMGAVILNRAWIGKGSMVAAGAVILEGTRVPPGSLVAGVPGRVRRQLTDEEIVGLRSNADAYVHLADKYARERPTVHW